MESEKFESWAIVEIFGHERIAGKVSEAAIGGGYFFRVDVPEFDGRAAFTKFFGNGAIYSMTPCSEEVARAALRQIVPAPVTVWIPEPKKAGKTKMLGQGCRRCGEIDCGGDCEP
jgi:hypothetical protein